MTDLEKREAFEAWLFSTEKFKTRNKNFLFMLDEYGNYEDIPVLEHWQTWQAAKAQVVQEGFVLVPKLLSDELADELAIDAFNNIQSMFDYEHRGSTATHREEIRLRWCKNKARDFQENYKAMIEAQEQTHD